MGIKFINDMVFSICPFWDIINISCMIKVATNSPFFGDWIEKVYVQTMLFDF